MKTEINFKQGQAGLVDRLIYRDFDKLREATKPGFERDARARLDQYWRDDIIERVKTLKTLDQLKQIKTRVDQWLNDHPEADGLNQCIKDRFESLAYMLTWWLNRGVTFEEFMQAPSHIGFEELVFAAECYAGFFLYDRKY